MTNTLPVTAIETRHQQIKQILEGQFGKGVIGVTKARGVRNGVVLKVNVVPHSYAQADGWKSEILHLLEDAKVKGLWCRDGFLKLTVHFTGSKWIV